MSCGRWPTAADNTKSRSTPATTTASFVDLLAEFRVGSTKGLQSLHFAGGLLGQWAVWTRRAADLLAAARTCRMQQGSCACEILAQSASLTDANAVLFDARNNFAGCIAGLHEILRRQGLLEGRWCLDPNEDLSPGQMEDIDRVCRAYPQLQDNDFIAQHKRRVAAVSPTSSMLLDGEPGVNILLIRSQTWAAAPVSRHPLSHRRARRSRRARCARAPVGAWPEGVFQHHDALESAR